ncbi:hypothetical protein H072_9066 [Dactylellina haptotyla CBS 200.50]|uniref:non-specific serine/threonine protein kinase n=1 Tax=Dactylellina haptotyla (strain CBS 200.50) TaxID=1284197 RepID=S8BDL2_DACHA|nr:hypothetical protein H072_9066 [Dactylellina haptotyla CBS 200.50]
MSSTVSNTWQQLFEDKRAIFSDKLCELDEDVIDEDAFRTNFEFFSRQHGERYTIAKLAKLHLECINKFAGAIDEALPHEFGNKVTAFMFSGIYVTVRCVYKYAHYRLNPLIELLAKLNKNIPEVSPNISRFADEYTVQNPLQEIFRVYMDSLLYMIVYLQKAPTDSELLFNIDSHIENAGGIFVGAITRFQHTMKLAERTENASSYGFPTTGRNDDRHSYDTQARFVRRRTLGAGSFGYVDEVEEVSTNQVFARKRILLDPNSGTRRAEEDVRNEVEIMDKLCNQHIARVLMYIKEESTCSIIMKAADCDLRTYLRRCGESGYHPNDLHRIIPWFGCLLDALAYAHGLNITHRDIKPGNILLKDGQVYLADFGLAKDLTTQQMSAASTSMPCGALIYRAPEVRPNAPRGPPADVFSLGCVFSEMLTVYNGRSVDQYWGYRDDPDGDHAFRYNLPQVYDWLSHIKPGTSDPSGLLLFIIPKMLAENPRERQTAQRGEYLHGGNLFTDNPQQR